MTPPPEAPLGQTHRYSAQEWEAQRPRIERLYIGEQRTLNDVMSIMKQEFGFVASGKQFKARITKWGLDVKNMKGNSITAMARARVNRKRYEAKDSAFRVNKKSVDERKINRYLKRNDISEDMLLSMPSPANAPSPAFSVYTPSPPTPDQCTSSLYVAYSPSLIPAASRSFEATSPYPALFELGWLQQTCTPCTTQSPASIGTAIAPPRIKRSTVHDPSILVHMLTSTPDAEAEADISMQDSFFHAAVLTPPSFPPLLDIQFDPPPMFDMSTPPYMRELPRPRFEVDSITKGLSSLFEDVNAAPPNTAARPSFSGQSPRLIDLLLPGLALNAEPEMVSIPPICMPTPAMSISPMDLQFMASTEVTQDSIMDDDVEEVIREPQLSESDLWMSLRAPPSFSRSATVTPGVTQDDPFNKIYRQPEVQAGSPEMLMLRFDKQTCGILSVKDGPTENPWRTLVWPLARDSPALYHAIASMTAFHTSKERPALRVDGMEYARRSIRSLARGIEKMRTDIALATTLVLAFSESWDQHISTGIEHLRGAKILVNQALIQHQKRNLSGDDLARLRFLCNTWVYMDVIARLTSVDDDETNDLDHVIPLNMPSFSNNAEVDPLMGCASTLFPLIGRAANLCQKVRRMETNPPGIVSQAIHLKEAIEQWCPPRVATLERPEDPTSEILHALQTAEAYRYATLLYLHQAVPEIPSWTSAQLAKKVLVYLATVPLSSRLVIVQIYPLLAAGCEAYEMEDRQWVEERWHSMASRMWIGSIDRCWEVVEEVWSRRDAAETAKNQKQKQRRREELTTEEMDMDPEYTVRGSMHWVRVMKDWEWELPLR